MGVFLDRLARLGYLVYQAPMDSTSNCHYFEGEPVCQNSYAMKKQYIPPMDQVTKSILTIRQCFTHAECGSRMTPDLFLMMLAGIQLSPSNDFSFL